MLDGCFLLASGIMLFARLGHYALWDDETMVALAAKGVLSSGDTTAVHGGNIAAYRSGLLLRDLYDRSTPPLTTYFVTPSIWLFGPTSLAARLPCAFLGIGLMGLVVVLLRKTQRATREAFIWYVAILGNISLFLFLRQSRYYAPSILLVTLIAVLYLSWEREKNKNLVGTIVLFSLLFATNYMACLAFFLCVGVDYGIWKRKTTPFPWKTALPWIIGSLACCGLIANVWNPYRTGFGLYSEGNSWMDRLILFFWNFRDTALCQFWVTGLLLIGLLLAFLKKDPWIFRGWVALSIFIAAVTLVSPQLIAGASVADVRYLAPIIPLGIAVSVRTYFLLFGSRPLLAMALSVPLFWTNLGFGAFIGNRPLASLPWSYLQELVRPPSEPFSPASHWISSHVRVGESVWVIPDYMAYPLMFHAPHSIYAWQLRPEQKQEKQFKNLPDIHFQGLVPPDFIVVFGPSVAQVRQLMSQWSMQGLRYQEVARLMTFWKDLYRPELFWRTFKPIEKFDPNTEAIYIFQRQS